MQFAVDATALAPILQRTLGERVTLVWRPEPQLAPISADRGQLEQVLLNLVLNARDAMPDGGTLTIETADVVLNEAQLPLVPNGAAHPGPHVALRVTDTGSGMSPDTIAHCFEPFYTTKETGKGTGLGLSSVHGIIHHHHGFIGVTSEPGRGTSFIIHLPAAADAASGIAQSERPPESGRTGTILLVEDEASVRQVAARALGGGRVRGAGGGRRGGSPRGAARLGRPGGSGAHRQPNARHERPRPGRALAAQLAAERPEVRVILMSGDTGALADRDEARANKIYLRKPFSPDMLLDTVREVLERAEHESRAR